MKELRKWQYYIIIGIISLLAIFFLPFVGSEAGLKWNLPTTSVGWVIYIISKLIVAIINILLFHCFILQAKTNISNNANFIEANKILSAELDEKTLKPKSPKERHKATYGKKGLTIFITSIFSAVGLAQAVLTFDTVTMLTYLFTIIMGIIFGILAMNDEELYWTSEYLAYAKLIQEENKKEKELCLQSINIQEEI